MAWDAHPLAMRLLRGIDTPRVLQALQESNGRAMGTVCACHEHSSWVPIEIHHVWPLGDGGPNIPTNRIPLCSNAHGSVHYYIDGMRKGDVPWDIRRRYGSAVRVIAEQGFEQIMASRLP